MKKIIFSLLVLLISLDLSALEIGKVPPSVELSDDKGGRLDGSSWNSSEIKDKVLLMFYVDPDEKNMNEHVSTQIKEQEFDRTTYGSIAIINMKATWLPNFAIAKSLKKKQEKYPHTLYLKDLDKTLVDAWKLKDDSSNILCFDKDGSLLFEYQGKLEQKDVDKLINIIKTHI